MEIKKELRRSMFQHNRFLLKDWESESFPFLFFKIVILLILFSLNGCATSKVEVGKITVVIQEQFKTAHKGGE